MRLLPLSLLLFFNFCGVTNLFSQAKLIQLSPQNPSSSAYSNTIGMVYYGEEINLFISEKISVFGGPDLTKWYIQHYDYSLNLVQEESIFDLPYTEAINSYEQAGGTYLSDTNGYCIYVSGINNSPNKTLIQLRDRSGNLVFNKYDFHLFDTHLLNDSQLSLHNILLKKNHRLHLFDLKGNSLISYDLDSLQTILSNQIFVNADSLFINSRVVYNPQTGISTYHLSQYENGLDSYYYANFNSSFQLLDSIKISTADDFRATLVEDDLLFRYDSIGFNTNIHRYQSKYLYKDFDGNLKRRVRSNGRIFYADFIGPWNTESLIFGNKGVLSICSTEQLLNTNQSGTIDTVRVSRFRYFDSLGLKQVDHLIFKDSLPISASATSLKNCIGRSSNGDFIIPISAWNGPNSNSSRSFLLKIDAQGNSPLSVQASLKPKKLSIYPNPSSQFLSIHSEEPDEEFRIKVLDLQGKTLLIQNTKTDQPIDVSILPNGTYLLEVRGKTKAGQDLFRFIKH
ncbi:T9SS type A sorting domain-containing protein [Croceimicrobium hydrocarbonivorans]|uniref:T9SS type A sorting domain-containing protein n=1 Tax=Croceimicrobium hydrocarbonivorans TaxID=2761580 RepID=A0A7H0VAM1_9FLAO|nr:T9SS type A sorting domain-containing protein [Croceimicrobium hydrocarbonivorans]QNR22769.1 T9SS type A sorting domain-containing protein [Croceimicrobium hydrocarbonivorans]